MMSLLYRKCACEQSVNRVLENLVCSTAWYCMYVLAPFIRLSCCNTLQHTAKNVKGCLQTQVCVGCQKVSCILLHVYLYVLYCVYTRIHPNVKVSYILLYIYSFILYCMYTRIYSYTPYTPASPEMRASESRMYFTVFIFVCTVLYVYSYTPYTPASPETRASESQTTPTVPRHCFE